MRIGQVADRVGLTSQTIRFYERQGLLPAPRRGPNGYRDYDDATIPRLQFIRTAQGAGLTLVEIASVVDLRDEGEIPCSHVHALLLDKLHDVRARQRELAGLEAELAHLIARSHTLDPADCTGAEICNILTSPD
ncbi:Cd(II)/Pb(II)-responsive transcriptional regulator [soil metagenome]|jgi:DNA-binding transcriptional MerR regulator